MQARRLAPVYLLITGITVNLYAQQLSDLKFAKPEAHILPTVKFIASVLFAALGKWQSPAVAVQPTPRQRRLMTLMGTLDAVAYVCFCLGFTRCGATLTSLVLAGSSQVFTALASRFVLKKQLSMGQTAAILLVVLGLGIRALPPSLFVGPKTQKPISSQQSSAAELWDGVALIGVAAVLYSALGVCYETLLSPERVGGEEEVSENESAIEVPPPPYSEILWNISIIGATGSLGYQFLVVYPNIEKLVLTPMAMAGLTFQPLAARLVACGVLFNVHMFAQSRVFKSQGALGVSLVNAVRGALLAVIIGAVFCTPAKPELCLTVQSGAAALVTTVGGLIWTLAGAKQTKNGKLEAVDDDTGSSGEEKDTTKKLN